VRKTCEVVVSKDGHSVTWSRNALPLKSETEFVCGEPAVEISFHGTSMCALHWDAYNEKDHMGPATTEMFKKALQE